MIETLISSKTRVKLLLKFFLNSNNRAYLRGLEQEFGDSSNSIRLELNRFEKAGLLKSSTSGNKKFFQADVKHPLYSDIRNIMMKHIGIDKIVVNVFEKIGNLNRVYVLGTFAKGLDSPFIDLLFVGAIDKAYLFMLVDKAEKLLKRKIRFIVYENMLAIDLGQFTVAPLLIWENELT